MKRTFNTCQESPRNNQNKMPADIIADVDKQVALRMIIEDGYETVISRRPQNAGIFTNCFINYDRREYMILCWRRGSHVVDDHFVQNSTR